MRRDHLPQAFFILCVLVGGFSVALGEPHLRPPLTFRPDDRVLSFGNTAASPDVSISWETTGAEDHLSAVVASGAGLLVSSDADTDRSGSIAAGATYLGVCSDDATAPTECIVSSHNGTDGIIATISGSTIIQSSTGATQIGDGVGNEGIRIDAAATAISELIFNADGDGFIVASEAVQDQGVIATGPSAGGQVNLTLVANYDSDHDHADQTNPTLYVHSATDPDTDNTEWGSLAFIAATDFFEITSGGNDINFSTASVANLSRLNATSGWRLANDREYAVGSDALAGFSFNTFDANAFAAQIALPAGTASAASVLQIGNKAAPTIVGADLGFFNGVTDPTLAMISTNNLGYVALSHDGTDAILRTNLGDINPQPASGFVRGMRRVIATTVAFNAASPLTLATVQDGDIVTGIWAEVVTAWNGDGTVNLGDGTDADGYLTDATLDKTVLGYKGAAHNTRGALLWDSGALELHDIDRIYTGADTVDATVVTGTSTLGSLTVYLELLRLK